MATTTRNRRIRIVQDEDPGDPRKEWDNLGRMVCWHRRYSLGDEQPSESGDEFLWNLAVSADESLEGEHHHLNGDVYEEMMESGWSHESACEEIDKRIIVLRDRVLGENFVIMPLFLYDHSGLSISTSASSFRMVDSAGWDWGQLGIIYCSLEKAAESQLLDEHASWDTPVVWKKPDGSQGTLREVTEYNLVCEVNTYDQYLTGDVWGFVTEVHEECAHCGRDEWVEEDSCWGFYGRDPFENGMSGHIDEENHDLLREAYSH